jgi:hypothetical protein
MIKKMSDAEYFAHPALNQSAFKNFLVSPWHYKWHKENPKPPTKDMVIGSLAHLLLLEPDSEWSRIHVIKTKTLTTKEAIQARETYPPEIIVTPEAWLAQAMLMLDESDIRSVVAGIPDDRREVAGFNTIKGVPIKAKADWIDDDGYICDLKTTNELDGFRYTWKKYGYNIQAMWYPRAFQEIAPAGFKIYPIGKDRPHDYEVFEVSETALADAADIIAENMPYFKECQEADHWPGKSKEPQLLGE